MNVQVNDKELLTRLLEQQEFLSSDIEQYQKGKSYFAYKIASTIRTILYTNPKGSSLGILPQLADKNGCLFLIKCKKRSPAIKGEVFQLGAMMKFGESGPQVPSAEDILSFPLLVPQSMSEFWNEVVYLDSVVSYTRGDLILDASNRLGGAHVDHKIPAKLDHLVSKNDVKIVFHRDGQIVSEESVLPPFIYEAGILLADALKTTIPCLQGKIK